MKLSQKLVTITLDNKVTVQLIVFLPQSWKLMEKFLSRKKNDQLSQPNLHGINRKLYFFVIVMLQCIYVSGNIYNQAKLTRPRLITLSLSL